MPAEFTVYIKVSDTKRTPATILYESPDKSYSVSKREVTIYNTDSLETAKEIGTRTIIYTLIDNITLTTLWYRFNELAGVPYGMIIFYY